MKTLAEIFGAEWQNGVKPGGRKLSQFRAALRAQGTPTLQSQEKDPDPIIYVKLFDPTSNWTWYITEWNEDDDEDQAFGYVVGHEPEFGYVSLTELSEVKGRFGIGIELDMHFAPQRLNSLGAPGRPTPEEIAAEVESRAIEAGLSPEAMACAKSAAENIGATIHIEDTPITPTPMSNTTLPAELEAKKDTLLTLVSHHVGTATFQRIQSFVLAKTGTKLQAFLTDASKPIEERAGFIDELTKILQSGDFTKLPPAAGAQAAAPKAALAPAPVSTPPANGLKPAFTVPTNGVACTPPPAAAPTPTQVVLTPPAAPADPIAALSAALAAIMPKPAAPAAPAIDEAAVRKLVREEMASVLASVIEALRQ